MFHTFKKITAILATSLLAFLLVSNTAHAEGGLVGGALSFVGLNPWDSLWLFVANLMQVFLTVMSWFLGLCGTLLNMAVFVTTHLGAFIKDTPAIYNIWTVIRDLSSMVLIFFILWAALQMILNIRQPQFGTLLRNIVIVGILINFSFFFTQVMIDASNIVSLQFYNAIAPNNEYQSGSKIVDWTSKAITGNGVSNIFMGALQVNAWYKNNAVIGGGSATGSSGPSAAPVRIILVTAGAFVVMFITSLSFVAAAAVCLLRTAMLILLLAFSPIWIAAWAMPELKEASKMWQKQFKAQLLFLPAYLMLMYVAIRILNESGLNQLAWASSSVPVFSQVNMGAYISLFVGFAINIVMLNVPLIGALSFAGAGGTATEKWFKSTQSWLGRNTAGRFASRINESNFMRERYANNPRVGMFVQSQLSKVSNASFNPDQKQLFGLGAKKGGFDKTRKDKIEKYNKFAGSLGYNEDYVRDQMNDFDQTVRNKLEIRDRAKRLLENNPSDRVKSEAEALRKSATRELEQLLGANVNWADNNSIESAKKKAKENKEKNLKGERKETVYKDFSDKRSYAAEGIRFVSGGRLFKGPNKYHKMVADAIKKEKTTADKLIDTLKNEVKGEDESEKGGGDKGGGDKGGNKGEDKSGDKK